MRFFLIVTDLPFLLPQTEYYSLCDHYPYGWNRSEDPAEDADAHPDAVLTDRELDLFRYLGA